MQTINSFLKRSIPYLIILLAFALQMGYLAELRHIFPDAFSQQPFCGVDAEAHWVRAQGLLDGTLPGNDTFYFIPFYPLYLAVLRSLFEDKLWLPLVLQALLQLAGIAALYSIGRMAFSRLTGVFAALGLATYNYYIFYLPCFDQALITVPTLTLTVFFLLKFYYQRALYLLLLAGILFGASTLSRPTLMILIPVVVFWLYLLIQGDLSPGNRAPGVIGSRRLSSLCSIPTGAALRQLTKSSLLFIIPFVVMVSPITWHNYQVSGRFILLSDNLGVNLFTGNNPDAAGLDSLAHVQTQPPVLRYRDVNERVKAGETTLTAEVWSYINQQPLDWLTLTGTKVRLWFVAADEPLVSPFFPLTVADSSLLTMLPLTWQAIALTALIALIFVMVPNIQHPEMMLLGMVYGLFSLTTIAFFIQLRFRLPFVPFVLLLSGSLLANAAFWQAQHRLRFWGVLAIMLGFCWLVPGLWVMALLYAGLGLLFAGERHAHTGLALKVRPRQISVFVLICLYLGGAGWWLQATQVARQASQSIDHYLGPPLVANIVLGQSFRMGCDGLHRIDFSLGLLDQPHDHPVNFFLTTDTTGQNILYSETFTAQSIADYDVKSITFPPIMDSAGRSFFFFLASPDSTPDNALTIRGYTDIPVDPYPDGQAWAGQLGALQPFQADMAFTAYCDLSVWQNLAAVIAAN